MRKDKIFAKGMRVTRRDKAPEWAVCQIGVQVAEFTQFLKEHEKQNGWVNINIHKGREGALYAELDTWVPNAEKNAPRASHEPTEGAVEYPQEEINIDDIPF